MFVHINAITVMTPEAEKFNGWAAMLGFVAAFGAYATTGQIIPGIICPVVAYAPKAATKPSIAAQPLNFSASGVIRFELFLFIQSN